MKIRVSHSHIKEAQSVKQYSYSQNKNFPIRKYMEDNYIAMQNFPQDKMGLFAILDGHGGSHVSEYCINAIPRIFAEEYTKNKQKIHQVYVNTCQRIDQELKLGEQKADSVGTTCCLVFIRECPTTQKRICTVGNLGDTRAVICQKGQAKRVSTDHKASSQTEQARIKSEGGCILQGRVGGQLAITRALGDLDFKAIGASNIPQIQDFIIDESVQYMIIASDGLWDVCQDDKVIQLTKEMQNSKEMSSKLVQYATKNGSRDNISVLALMF